MDGTVVICHSRIDKEYARQLDIYLTEQGLRCVTDHTPKSGPRVAQFFAELDRCAAVVVVMTPAASGSTWVKQAIVHAMEHNIALLPLLRHGVPFESLGRLESEDARDGQMPGAPFVERLRTLARAAGEAGALPAPADFPAVRVVGQTTDMREYLGQTAACSLLLAAAAALGWATMAQWSPWLASRYATAAGLTLVIVALAVAMRWSPLAVSAAWLCAAHAPVILVGAGVLAWRIAIDHAGPGWSLGVAGLLAALVWFVAGARLARLLGREAEIKGMVREHEQARRLATGQLWLGAGEPPSILGKLLQDHVRGARLADAYFGYAVVASASVVFVDTSGMTNHPDLRAKATELAAWARRVRGRPYSINVTPSFVAVDEKVPMATVMTVDDVDIVRVPAARLATTVRPLLERGPRSLYLPLLAAVMRRVPQ